MARIKLEDLLDQFSRRAGLPDTPLPALRRMVEATLAALARELPSNDLRALALVLPPELGPSLRERSAAKRPFFQRVAREEHVSVPTATEHAQSLLRVLGETLDRELVLRMKKHLTPELAEHLDERSIAEPSTRPKIATVAGPRTTLSSGRAGSEHPLSASASARAHAHSVARNSDPHSETKLSSARGLTQERRRAGG